MFIRLHHSKVVRFTVSTSTYQAGYVAISLNPKEVAFNQALAAHFKQIFHSLPLVLLPDTLICLDMAKAEAIYLFLKAQVTLPPEDCAAICALNQQVKKITAQRNTLQHQVNPAQETILVAVDEVYIDDILEHCNNYTTAVTLLRCAFNREVNPASLKQFLATQQIDPSVQESIIALGKVIHGQANMETTLTNMGHLPTLESQRFMVNNHCLKKLGETFSDLDDTNQLYMFLGLLMVRIPVDADPFADFKLVIKQALGGNSHYFKYFKPDLMVTVTHVFQFMGILAKNKQPDLARIKDLQQSFASPLLELYLAQLDEPEETELPPIFKALSMDSPGAVHAALSENRNLELFHPHCGRTPLHIAVQECSTKTLAAVLHYYPKLVTWNKGHTFTPVYGAISVSREEHLHLLLEAGVDLTRNCGATKVKADFFQTAPDFAPATPIVHAINKQLQDPSPARVNIIKQLLHYGAAIMFSFSPAACRFIDENTVALGAKFPAEFKVKAITTPLEFTQRIDRTTYQHWEKVLGRTMKHLKSTNREWISLLMHLRMMISLATLFDENPRYQPCLQALNEQNYNRAFRIACTCNKHEHGISIVKALLNHQEFFKINVHATSKSNSMTPYDYANKAGNDTLCDLLKEYGATPSAPTRPC